MTIAGYDGGAVILKGFKNGLDLSSPNSDPTLHVANNAESNVMHVEMLIYKRRLPSTGLLIIQRLS
jgi:hypothetical protein